MKMVKLRDYEKAVNKAAEVITTGGLVVFPSDTVYGLAVDPTKQKAVDKLLAFKNRWTGKAISVAVADKRMAKEYVRLSKEAEDIYDNLLPGPFTVISQSKKSKVADGIEAEDGSLGVRIVDNKLMTDLAKKLGRPFTATSANLAGRSCHYSIDSFLRSLSEKKKNMIDLVVDGGKLPRNKPSTVINTVGGEIEILRRGDVVGGKGRSLISKSETETKKIAEFLLKKHRDDRKLVVLGLTGDLGAGKTVFARGIGRALEIKGKITSPTFVIVNEYRVGNLEKGKVSKFLHFDLYKIENEEELTELGFLELFETGVVACIEWPERMGKDVFEKLKKKVNYVGVKLEYVDEKTRRISGWS